MADFINTVDVIGDDTLVDSIICRTVTEYHDNATKTIGSYAFSNCTSLTSVNLPVATKIGKRTFYQCSSLTSVSFPAVTSIGEHAFSNCTSLTSVSFPAVISSSTSVFSNCTSLTSVSFPRVQNIDTNMCHTCTSLTSVNCPLAKYVNADAFYNCSKLTSVDLPSVTSIDRGFRKCSQLTALILRNNAVCTLSNTSTFTDTPIASGTGYIYVPAALVDSYKAATNWSTYADQFRALEDYTVDGTVTGELDETKI